MLYIYLNISSRDPHFENAYCPQQTNGYDCGVFVVLIAQCLAEYIHDSHILDDILEDQVALKQILLQSVNPEKATMFRNHIYSEINSVL